MDWCTGQSKKHFRTPSLLGQEQQVKDGCCSTFSFPTSAPTTCSSPHFFPFFSSASSVGVFLLRATVKAMNVDSWCDSSTAAFQIIPHDLNIQTVLFNTEYRSRCPCISIYFGSHWKSLRGRNILQEPLFLSHSFSLEKLLAITIFLLRVHTSNGQPRLQQEKKKKGKFQ